MFICKKMLIITMTIIIICLFTGCLRNSNLEIAQTRTEEIEKINLNIIKSTQSNLGTFLELELINNSKYRIIENNIFVTYPLKIDKGYKENKYKIEVPKKILNLAPDQKIYLTVLMPYDNFFDKKAIVQDIINYKIEGYFLNVSNITSYFKEGYLEIEP